MPVDEKTVREVARFKRIREDLIQSDDSELAHYLVEFVAELHRNPIIQRVRSTLPEFDVNPWWQSAVGNADGYRIRLDHLKFPDEDDERLVALLDLAESMASDEQKSLTVNGFGQLFGRHKKQDCIATVRSLILRPLVDMLGDRMREEVAAINPVLRELAGVPLSRIPGPNETLIFLSHKTVDKPLVRGFEAALREMGLEPWLDEKSMRPGDKLHREIASGFDRACAVVFFVTKNFKDERWLRHEVDLAVERGISLGEARFRFITLVFDGAEVPEPLKKQLYVEVTSEAQALAEIVRGLPIELGPARWRS